MFSNDRNIGIVGRLIEMFRHYIGLQNEYLRLDVIEKVVRLITGLLIFSAMFLFIVIILIYQIGRASWRESGGGAGGGGGG